MRARASFRSSMTADAVQAFERIGMSRRRFLKVSGVLLVGFSASPLETGFAQRTAVDGPGSSRLDAWIAIASDGTVTAYTGKCEFGQGLLTAQMQLVAEELSVPFRQVTMVQCDTNLTPDQGTTSGAQSHPTNFNTANLALAAATAREALMTLAATRLSVAVDQLIVADGVVRVAADRTRAVSYGELIGGRSFELTLNRGAVRKHPREWKVLGTSVPRVDLPAMVAGRFEYVHNVRVPGMLHGRVVRPPTIGATLIAVDETSVNGMPGVVKVVVKKNFVGVVAEKLWQAVRAAAVLKTSWTPGPNLALQNGFYDSLRRQTPTRDTLLLDSKDVATTLKSAARVISGTYLYPYQMHGSMGTSCAVADVGADAATIWSATQAVFPLKSSVAQILGYSVERVHVLFRMGAGCYGINGADTVSYDAALLSQAVGRPVRVQLTRKDEMAWENYGYAFVIDERVGLDGDGTIVAWDHEVWFPTLGGRPGSNAPGNVITGFLAGFQPAAFTPRAPAPEPADFANNTNAIPSYVAGCVGGRCHGSGTVRSERVQIHNVRSSFWTGQLRAPERLQNTFAHESFMDEIAAATGADPIAYRLRHLTDPRLIEVIQAAATASKWETRPSPRALRRTAGVVSGRGMSSVLYYGDNGYCAMVAEVDVDQDSGAVTARKLVIAIDCGPISNPDGLRHQLEGAALQGLSRTLLEEVTWDAQQITSIDWKSYRLLSLGDPIPVIESVLIDRPNAKATGAGETAVTLIGAALGNAIFDATGVRLRQVPFTPARVKAALALRA